MSAYEIASFACVCKTARKISRQCFSAHVAMFMVQHWNVVGVLKTKQKHYDASEKCFSDPHYIELHREIFFPRFTLSRSALGVFVTHKNYTFFDDDDDDTLLGALLWRHAARKNVCKFFGGKFLTTFIGYKNFKWVKNKIWK